MRSVKFRNIGPDDARGGDIEIHGSFSINLDDDHDLRKSVVEYFFKGLDAYFVPDGVHVVDGDDYPGGVVFDFVGLAKDVASDEGWLDSGKQKIIKSLKEAISIIEESITT